MTIHAIRCKKTGEEIAIFLDGRSCACPSADECVMRPAPRPLPKKMITFGEALRIALASARARSNLAESAEIARRIEPQSTR